MDDRVECVDVAIVGAGAAGLMAAIWAGRTDPNRKIVLLDGAKKLGRKILIAGGGRCNVTHHAVTADAYAGGSRNAIKKVLKRFDVPQTVDFFRQLGVELKREETGKLFPTTDRASTVLDALLTEVQRSAEIRHPCRVESVTKVGDLFHLSGPWGEIRSRVVVLATGGKSIPKTGSDGYGYRLVTELGHSLTPDIFPALVPLMLPRKHFTRMMSGLTLETELTLWSATGKRLTSFKNSTLCTHFGLSGPSVLDISRYYLAAQRDDPNVMLTINWAPSLSPEQLSSIIVGERKRQPISILREVLPDRLAKCLVEVWIDAFEPNNQQLTKLPCNQLPKKARQALVNTVTRLPLPITGSRGFDFAEVTAGGVPLTEINLKTMESRITSGLHLCGEILDVDGRIGGFNFQWAWASGYTAGSAVGQEK